MKTSNRVILNPKSEIIKGPELLQAYVLPVFEAVQVLEEGRHALAHGDDDGDGDDDYGDIFSPNKKIIQISKKCSLSLFD